RLPESTGTDPADVLDRLGLRVNGEILNAAVVLFGKVFLPNYTQCQIRLARFKGTTKTEFIDNKQLYGHAFSLLDEAMFFIQRHLPVAGRITPGVIERIDEPIFPPLALREALVNAFCHRDYANPGGAVSVAIFDDRLEIWSEGVLPFGLKVEDLKRDHPSRPRNPLIADVFFRRGLVERWGRGTQTIVELCVKAGHPEPDFVEQAGSVGVRFIPQAYVAPHRVGHDLTTRQREILQILAERPLPLREIMGKITNPPAEATLRDDLYHLKKLSMIVLTGYGRGAKWFLVREENNEL
ncbi:MAG: ATP-binding protein, partial [Bacillota bacterium]